MISILSFYSLPNEFYRIKIWRIRRQEYDSVRKFCVNGKDTSLAKSQARRYEYYGKSG